MFTQPHRILCFIALLLLLGGVSPAKLVPDIETEALKALKNAITNDPLGALSDWNDTNHHCNWFGILCDMNHVVSISLYDKQLEGVISPFLGNISTLEILDVSSNSFSGKIPPQLGRCSQLQQLSFYENALLGPIPPELGKLQNLQFMDFRKNFLNGSIPESITNCTALLELYFNSNNLTGPIPSNIGNFVNMEIFGAYNNFLTGSIPSSIGKMGKQLTSLRLGNNKFAGPIPSAISKLELLTYLDLSRNRLDGSIPKSMAQLSRLTSLDLSHNLLEGVIPASVIVGMKHLEISLSLSNNLLVGPVPSELGMLEMVQVIDLSKNNLSGNIPETLRGCMYLSSLDMSGNKLSGSIPNIIFQQMHNLESLNLSNNQFDGFIPESLTNLNLLDLSQNKLTGGIPEKLANASSLAHLNLSNNQLEGPVPKTGVFKNLNPSSLDGNLALCGTSFLSPCAESKAAKRSNGISKKTILILAVLGSVAIFLFLILAIAIFKRRSRKTEPKEVESIEPDYAPASTLMRYDQKDLEQATDFFSEENIIGSSNLSTVYKGRSEDGQIIAVKVLNLHQFPSESDKSFRKELKTLSHLRHRNLVKVLGYGWESKKLKALVLEYMENGNLDRVIHGSGVDNSRWGLPERIEILVSIARGLAYLHSSYDFPIVHCDLKPSNILLDGRWDAHVSDFGTARILGVHLQDGASIATSSAFQGTIGYMAPEFAYMRKVTTKVDVFSFGIIVIELLTKKRPTGLTEENGVSITLPQTVEKAVATGNKGLLEIIDPQLAPHVVSKDQDIVEDLLKLALSCTCTAPEDRPDMNALLSSLTKLNKRMGLSTSSNSFGGEGSSTRPDEKLWNRLEAQGSSHR